MMIVPRIHMLILINHILNPVAWILLLELGVSFFLWVQSEKDFWLQYHQPYIEIKIKITFNAILAYNPALKAIYILTPAETKHRNVVRDDYSYNLTIHFKNIDGHNAYQIDPLHKAFVEKFSAFWQRIEIIDSD